MNIQINEPHGIGICDIIHNRFPYTNQNEFFEAMLQNHGVRFSLTLYDLLPSSLIDSNVSMKWKQ
jgi:hypothetical protein